MIDVRDVARSARLPVVVLMLCAAMLAGCTHESPPPAPEVKRPPVPYSVVWSGASGVDLNSRPAELIRASLESATMARWAGVKFAFPGYDEALAHDAKYSELFGLKWQEPNTNPRDDPQPWLYNYHIGAMTHADDRVTATVCTLRRFDRSTLSKTPPGPNDTPWQTFGGVTFPVTYTVELTRKTTDPDQPTGAPDRSAEDHDPHGSKVPSWNVFGDWSIREISNDIDGDYTQPECTSWWRQVFPGWTAPASAPEDFTPPFPMSDWEWPNVTGVDSLPMNYPEWIERTGDKA